MKNQMMTDNLANALTTDHNSLSEPVRNLIHFFQNITPESVTQIEQLYTGDAYFKDPFNEVHTRQDILQIFKRMFHQVENPRFVIHTAFESGEQVFLGWNFFFSMQRFKKGQIQSCTGSSHIKVNVNGQIQYHRDYWDPAQELYEKIPVLGSLMRWLKKQAA